MAKGEISDKNTTFSFVIPKDLKEAAHKIATEQHRSLSNLIVSLIDDYVNKCKPGSNCVNQEQSSEKNIQENKPHYSIVAAFGGGGIERIEHTSEEYKQIANAKNKIKIENKSGI